MFLNRAVLCIFYRWGKLEQRSVNWFVWNHIASKVQTRDLNSRQSSFRVWAVTALFCKDTPAAVINGWPAPPPPAQPLQEMLFTEHLCKAVSVARKQFHLRGTQAHSFRWKPFQRFFLFWKIKFVRRVVRTWRKTPYRSRLNQANGWSPFRPLLHLLLPSLSPSLDPYSVFGCG